MAGVVSAKLMMSSPLVPAEQSPTGALVLAEVIASRSSQSAPTPSSSPSSTVI